MARKLLLTRDRRLAFVETGLERHVHKVDLGANERLLVLGFFALEAVAVLRAAPDRPAAADELGRIEGLAAIDGEGAETLHHEVRAVLEEQREAPAELLFGHPDDAIRSLDGIAIQAPPVGVANDASDELVRLSIGWCFHELLLEAVMR